MAHTTIPKMIPQLQFFRFHTPPLHLPQHTKHHENPISQILPKINILQHYPHLTHHRKIHLLPPFLQHPPPLTSPYHQY
ncbi:phosphoenolpyruvate carboxylase, partial [Paenibacillus xylanexedens]|uniref:phosphoenolpyruvate carboxylase n=1 Tax=Paenibacillus xylanexedens TaxID=528191 RepID=UPI0034D96CC6